MVARKRKLRVINKFIWSTVGADLSALADFSDISLILLKFINCVQAGTTCSLTGQAIWLLNLWTADQFADTITSCNIESLTNS